MGKREEEQIAELQKEAAAQKNNQTQEDYQIPSGANNFSKSAYHRQQELKAKQKWVKKDSQKDSEPDDLKQAKLARQASKKFDNFLRREEAKKKRQASYEATWQWISEHKKMMVLITFWTLAVLIMIMVLSWPSPGTLSTYQTWSNELRGTKYTPESVLSGGKLFLFCLSTFLAIILPMYLLATKGIYGAQLFAVRATVETESTTADFIEVDNEDCHD